MVFYVNFLEFSDTHKGKYKAESSLQFVVECETAWREMNHVCVYLVNVLMVCVRLLMRKEHVGGYFKQG